MSRFPKRIRVISFDLDGTLVDFSFADAVWLHGMSKLLSQTEGVSQEIAQKILINIYNQIGEEDVRWYKLDFWFKELGIPGSPRELLLKHKHLVKPYPETQNVLKQLASKFKLVLLSNASREFLEIEIEEAGIKTYFSRIISTVSDLGEVKSPDVFKEICRIFNVDADEVIHVGDHKKFDHIIPSSIGMNTLLISRHNRLNDKSILNLKELLYLLKP